jgi:ankyrin repeat protein
MSSSSCISSDDFKCGTNYSMLYSSILFKYEIAGLHYAKYLIDNGCDVNAINSSGDTVIHQIAKHSRKRFIKPKDHHMSRGRHLKLDLKYLIDVGCDLNAVNTRGKTALHYCIKEIDPSTTKYLIEMGADFNIQDADNLNAYEYAFRDFDETPSDNKIDIYFEDAAGSLYTENIKDIDVTFVNGHSDIDSKSNFLADYIASVTYKETSSQKPPLPNDRIVHLFKIIMILLENGANFYENPEFLEKKPMWFKSLIIKCKNELSKRNSNDSKTKFQPVKLSIEVAKLTRYFHENCGIEPANSSKYASTFLISR